jgi:hypothetical protein
MMRGIEPDWVDPAGQRMGLAFKCESPAEVDTTFARLTAAGYPADDQRGVARPIGGICDIGAVGAPIVPVWRLYLPLTRR